MTHRRPSIIDPEDFRTLAYALEHDGELPGWMPEYVRDAFLHAGWFTDDKVNEIGLETARKWVEIRQGTAEGFRPSGSFTPLAGQKD